jgi:hypothetical protein
MFVELYIYMKSTILKRSETETFHSNWKNETLTEMELTTLVQPFYFISYYFSWIEYDDFFFHFQETNNNQLRERYGDDPSTHPDFVPDLWMEVGLSSGSDTN